MKNVVDQIRIVTHPKARILAATVVESYRSFLKVNCDTRHSEEGMIFLSWDILEKGDGAVIGLTYEGLPNIDIDVKGTIEHQGQLRGIAFPYYKLPIREQIILNRKNLTAFIESLAYTVFFILLLTFFPPKSRSDKAVWCFIAFCDLLLVVLGALQLYLTAPPPFLV
jgi:hypothetical protein